MTLVLNDVTVDNTEVEATWTAIQGRISRSPKFQVLPEDAMATIETVIMRHHDEAFDLWPGFSVSDKKHRVHFWKSRVLDFVEPEKRGLYAVYFHEYVAATDRGTYAEPEEDLSPIPYYGGHARAAHDAYVACTASLD